MSDSVRLNQWAQYKYLDAEEILVGLRRIERTPEVQNLPDDVRTLRTHKSERIREGRQAALFCHGISSCVVGAKVLFAHVEDEDFDFIARWQEGENDQFCPVQLKEWVPAKRHETITGFHLARLEKEVSPVS